MLTILVGCGTGCAKEKTALYEPDARAQEDFYEYVNQDFLSLISLGNQNIQWTWFGELDASIHVQMKNLIQEAKEDPLARKEEAFRKILDLDECILDWKSRDSDGFWKLENNLDALEHCSSIEEYIDCLAVTYSEYGLQSLFGGYSVDADFMDSGRYAVYLLEADTLLGREYYENPELESMTKSFEAYIEQMLMLYGLKEDLAKQKAAQINQFVKELSLHSFYIEDYQDPQKSYHPYTKEELAKLFSNVNLEYVLETEHLSLVDRFIVRDEEQAKWVNSILTEDNLELLKWYSIFVALHDMSRYGPRAYAECFQSMENILYGTGNSIDDENTRLYLEEQFLPWEFAQLYLTYLCPNNEVEKVEELVEMVKASYIDILNHQNWMSSKTKKKAQTKLEKMETKLGFPKDIEQMQIMEITSCKEGGSLIKNVLKFMHQNMILLNQKIGTPVNKEIWSMTPQTVNAYYSPTNNEIVFPMAILQPPFYSPDYSLGKNLGGIGFIIAHEISHAFDSNGSKYDEYGNVNDWWTKKEREIYKALGNEIKEYYESYDVIGIPVNGELTLAENIADLGAMSCISNILQEDEEQLEQAFIQYAHIWAGKTSITYQTYLLHSDCHAPNKVRVNAVLSSCDDFYRIYQIKSYHGMYRKRRVGIWQ